MSKNNSKWSRTLWKGRYSTDISWFESCRRQEDPSFKNRLSYLFEQGTGCWVIEAASYSWIKCLRSRVCCCENWHRSSTITPIQATHDVCSDWWSIVYLHTLTVNSKCCTLFSAWLCSCILASMADRVRREVIFLPIRCPILLLVRAKRIGQRQRNFSRFCVS